MPQLQNICAVEEMGYLRYGRSRKRLVIVGALSAVAQLRCGKVGKVLGEYGGSPFRIGHIRIGYYLIHGKGGYLNGDKKPALVGDALDYGLC